VCCQCVASVLSVCCQCAVSVFINLGFEEAQGQQPACAML
jgi:hypothetical protein